MKRMEVLAQSDENVCVWDAAHAKFCGEWPERDSDGSSFDVQRVTTDG